MMMRKLFSFIRYTNDMQIFVNFKIEYYYELIVLQKSSNFLC